VAGGARVTRLWESSGNDELLVGMRTIHQVLPAIMKKLGIHDEFKLEMMGTFVDLAWGTDSVQTVLKTERPSKIVPVMLSVSVVVAHNSPIV
jgi:hypothetical protein